MNVKLGIQIPLTSKQQATVDGLRKHASPGMLKRLDKLKTATSHAEVYTIIGEALADYRLSSGMRTKRYFTNNPCSDFDDEQDYDQYNGDPWSLFDC